MITATHFREAFFAEWTARIADHSTAILEAYSNDKLWTAYMLSYQGFMSQVTERLHKHVDRVKYFREVYTLDAILVGGEDLFRTDLCYPSRIYALVEHENGENVEEEMWKLIFWRAPLKILIFYDWNESCKTTKSRQAWLFPNLDYLMEVGAFIKLNGASVVIGDLEKATQLSDHEGTVYTLGNPIHI